MQGHVFKAPGQALYSLPHQGPPSSGDEDLLRDNGIHTLRCAHCQRCHQPVHTIPEKRLVQKSARWRPEAAEPSSQQATPPLHQLHQRPGPLGCRQSRPHWLPFTHRRATFRRKLQHFQPKASPAQHSDRGSAREGPQNDGTARAEALNPGPSWGWPAGHSLQG